MYVMIYKLIMLLYLLRVLNYEVKGNCNKTLSYVTKCKRIYSFNNGDDYQFKQKNVMH